MKVKVTAKVEAVTPDPGQYSKLEAFLRAYRDWTQYIIDQIWGEKQVPSLGTLHRRFYQLLRSKGFRANTIGHIHKRAREAVKAVRRNRGSKPVLRRLTARIHYRDYRFDPETKTLRVAVLNDEWVELRLHWYPALNRYLGNGWEAKALTLTIRGGRVWVYITFEKEVESGEPRAVMGVDVNFDSVAYSVVGLDGRLITMGVIPFRGLRRALVQRIVAEKIQRKYAKQWRYVKGVRRAIRRHGKRARDILTDTCHHMAHRLVRIAAEYGAAIALEDLNKLRSRVNGGRRFNKALSLWTYRRLQGYITYKALARGLPVLRVDPRDTSKTSPIGGELRFINYRWVRLPNGVTTTRDVVASWNLARRGLEALTRDVGPSDHVAALNAPNQMHPQEGMKGNPEIDRKSPSKQGKQVSNHHNTTTKNHAESTKTGNRDAYSICG